MSTQLSRLPSIVGIIGAATLFAACTDSAPIAPSQPAALSAVSATAASWDRSENHDEAVLATLRRVTARYHDLDAALADGFVFLHGCEVRGDEGPVGTVYVNFARLLDGKIDPNLPDGLIYSPSKNGKPKLAAVEFAVPYALWTGPTAPTFLGATFQREDEFGVFGLHVWVWRNNPEGMFAESNPNISCSE